jgi:HEAT repeat protein
MRAHLVGCALLFSGLAFSSHAEEPRPVKPTPEYVELLARIEKLEQAVKECRTANQYVFSDDVVLGLLKSGETDLIRAGALLARKNPSPVTRQFLMEQVRLMERAGDQRLIFAQALQGIQSPQMQAMWIELINDPVEEIGRLAAETASSNRNPEAVPELLKAAEYIRGEETKYNYRHQAVLTALSNFNDPRAIPLYIRLLRIPRYRPLAITELIETRDETVREAVWDWFKGQTDQNVFQSPTEQAALIRLFRELKETRSGPVLLKWMGTANATVRTAITDALPYVCKQDTLPQLIPMLNADVARLNRGDPLARTMIVPILSILGGERSAQTSKALLDFLKVCTDQSTSLLATQHLRNAMVPEALPELVEIHNLTKLPELKQELAHLIKEGRYEVHWIESTKTFGLGAPKVEK